MLDNIYKFFYNFTKYTLIITLTFTFIAYLLGPSHNYVGIKKEAQKINAKEFQISKINETKLSYSVHVAKLILSGNGPDELRKILFAEKQSLLCINSHSISDKCLYYYNIANINSFSVIL